MSRIPDITRNPDQWFRYFDTNHSGSLDTQSVINGFHLTFPSVEKEVLTSIISEMWPIFDHDGNGSITLSEFLARDGLCDTLVAQMNPHFNEVDAPSDEPTQTPACQYYQAPPPYQAPVPAYGTQHAPALQLRCGHCGNLQMASPPHGVRSFLAICGSCGSQNQVDF